MSGSAPAIDTPRTRLRAHRAGDYDACVALWSAPAVTRFIGGKPSTPQQTWSRLLAYAGHWALLGYGYWAIEDRETGAYLGELGFADFKRDVVAAMRGVPELGYALVPAAHGRGLGTETVRAAVAYADAHVASRRTVCAIAPENAPSLAVARACGYAAFDRGAIGGAASLFLERIRP